MWAGHGCATHRRIVSGGMVLQGRDGRTWRVDVNARTSVAETRPRIRIRRRADCDGVQAIRWGITTSVWIACTVVIACRHDNLDARISYGRDSVVHGSQIGPATQACRYDTWTVTICQDPVQSRLHPREGSTALIAQNLH